MKLILPLILSCLFLSACSIKPFNVQSHELDNEFIIAEILATGLVLGSVTSSRIKMDKTDRDKYNKLMENYLSTYPIYGDFSNDRLRKAITEQEYNYLISHYDNTESIPEDLYDNLRDNLSPARYLMFAHLTRNDLDRFTSNINHSINLNTRRTMSASVKVFNLLNKKIVLNTKISASKTNSSSGVQFGASSLLGIGLQIGISHSLTGSYPKPPETIDVLSTVFLGIRDQLPKK